MTFYTDLQTVATDLLTQFGQNGTWRQESNSYDPSTGTNMVTSTDTTVKLAILPLPRGRDEFSEELIEMSTNSIIVEAKALVAASVTPTSNDKIVVGSTIYQITDLTPINPAGTPVVYKMLVAN